MLCLGLKQCNPYRSAPSLLIVLLPAGQRLCAHRLLRAGVTVGIVVPGSSFRIRGTMLGRFLDDARKLAIATGGFKQSLQHGLSIRAEVPFPFR